jgi:phosphate transport system substrate-binding protein
VPAKGEEEAMAFTLKPALGALIAGLALLGLALPGVAAPVRISGAPSFNDTVFQLHKAEIERLSGTTISTIAISSERGIDDLFAGRAEIAMLGARLESVVQTVLQKRKNIYDAQRLVEHVLGESRILFVVNRSNPVKTVSRTDLAGILGGRIGTWSSVGGNSHPILVAVEPTDAMYPQIQNALLSPLSLTWTPRSRVLESPLQVPALIAQAPDAIGYMSSLAVPELKERVAILDTEIDLRRMQVIATLDTASADAKRVVEATRIVVARLSGPSSGR